MYIGKGVVALRAAIVHTLSFATVCMCASAVALNLGCYELQLTCAANNYLPILANI